MPQTNPVHPKVVSAGAGGLLATIILVIDNFSLSPTLRNLIVAAAAFAAGWLKK